MSSAGRVSLPKIGRWAARRAAQGCRPGRSTSTDGRNPRRRTPRIGSRRFPSESWYPMGARAMCVERVGRRVTPSHRRCGTSARRARIAPNDAFACLLSRRQVIPLGTGIREDLRAGNARSDHGGPNVSDARNSGVRLRDGARRRSRRGGQYDRVRGTAADKCRRDVTTPCSLPESSTRASASGR
jgi:hypothetical protein